MKFVIRSFAIFLFLCISAIAIEAEQKNSAPETKQDMGWQQLGEGLELGTFLAPQPAVVGDSLVRVLRIDPKYYRLRLLNASAIENGAPLTPKQWCRQNGLIAAINPSMFQTDYKTSVSLMRTRAHTNNPRLSKDMTILAFLEAKVRDPGPEHPHAIMHRRKCLEAAAAKMEYGGNRHRCQGQYFIHSRRILVQHT
jgi:hypothetical protein